MGTSRPTCTFWLVLCEIYHFCYWRPTLLLEAYTAEVCFELSGMCKLLYSR